MPTLHLTDIVVSQLKQPGIYFDRTISNFGLRVGKRRKTWIVVRGRERLRTRIGQYPTVKLGDARRAAHKLLGADLEPKKKQPVTFVAALPLFLEENYRARSPRTKYEAKRHLETHLLPALKNKLLPEITDEDIGKRLDKLSKVPSEQLHCFRVARTFFRWCTRPPRRYLPHSPLEGYPAPSQDKKRSRVLTEKEVAKVWNACDGVFGDMVRLLFLWGTRSGETARLRRAWIEDEILTIPGAFTKNGRAHSIPLLPMAKEILERQRGKGEYFFPGHIKDSHFNDGSWGKLKRVLDEASAVSDWQVRDIRRTFRSTLAKLGIPREIAEILLNHVTGANKNDLDEIYNRYDYLEEKRSALAKLEAHLTKLLAR
jgi:integrase